jgi:hypothetical protein
VFGLPYTLGNAFGLLMVIMMYTYFVRVWHSIRNHAEKRGNLRTVPVEAVLSLSGVFLICVYGLGPSIVCYGTSTAAEINAGTEGCDDTPSWVDSEERGCVASFYRYECGGFIDNNDSILEYANAKNISALQACCACDGGTVTYDHVDPCFAGQSVDFIMAYQALFTWMAKALLINEKKKLSLTQLFAVDVNIFQTIAISLFSMTTLLTIFVFGARDSLVEKKELYNAALGAANVFIAMWLGIFFCLVLDTFLFDNAKADVDQTAPRASKNKIGPEAKARSSLHNPSQVQESESTLGCRKRNELRSGSPAASLTPLASSKAAVGVAVDTTGDGVFDSVALDTTGDGTMDTVLLGDTAVGVAVDTTGDGVFDSVALDTTGDGIMDTVLLGDKDGSLPGDSPRGSTTPQKVMPRALSSPAV